MKAPLGFTVSVSIVMRATSSLLTGYSSAQARRPEIERAAQRVRTGICSVGCAIRYLLVNDLPLLERHRHRGRAHCSSRRPTYGGKLDADRRRCRRESCAAKVGGENGRALESIGLT